MPASLVSLLPAAASDRTVSLLVIVWNRGLNARESSKIADALSRYAGTTHEAVNLGILSRSHGMSAWNGDPAVQGDLLLQAAAQRTAIADTPDEASQLPATSDGRVLRQRWHAAVSAAVRDLDLQPGAHVVLELLPPPRRLPPYGGPAVYPVLYDGERQVHDSAVARLDPVYRVLNSEAPTPLISPYVFSRYNYPALSSEVESQRSEAAFGRPGNVDTLLNDLTAQEVVREEEQIIPVNIDPLPRPTPASALFAGLGGFDIWDLTGLPAVLRDTRNVYTVTVRSPAACQQNWLLPVRPGNGVIPQTMSVYYPPWLLPELLGTGVDPRQ